MDNCSMPLSLPLDDAMLARSLADVLEAVAFVSLMPLDSDIHTPPAEAEMYWIEFSGAYRGAVELVVPRQFSQMLTDNLLGPAGENDDSPLPDPGDGMKELLNVLCGKVLQELPSDLVSRIEMGLPQRRIYSGEAQWQEFHATAETFDADGHPITVRMRLEPVIA